MMRLLASLAPCLTPCLALCLIPVTQAQATEFRCYPPDPAGYFQAVQASPAEYQIVRGRFQFDPALLPKPYMQAGDLRLRPIPAQFVGQVLGPDGFVADTSFDLTLEHYCTMVSCPYLEAGVEVVAFIRLGPEGRVLDADPCLAPVFAATDDTTELLLSCLRGGDCVARNVLD